MTNMLLDLSILFFEVFNKMLSVHMDEKSFTKAGVGE